MIRLDRFTAEDIPELLSWLDGTDAAFLCQFAGPGYNYPLSKEQLTATIESDDYIPLKAVDSVSGRVIGHCQFMRIDHESSTASIGRLLINPEQRGGGLGRLMVDAMKEYAGKVLMLKRLDLRVYDFNQSAVRCYRNAGFTEEGRETVSVEAPGEEWICISMGCDL